jgi:hypothetical protein
MALSRRPMESGIKTYPTENGVMLRIVVASFLVLSFVCEADAWPRRRRSRSSSSSVSFSGGPQAVASAKASHAASRGIRGHVGGGFGGGRYEGVGFSAYSAQQALNNCCYTGQRRVAGSAVARGSNGWYACKIYW